MYPRRMRRPALALCVFALAFACGPGSPGGPTINNRLGSEPAPSGPENQSNDILARTPQAARVEVRHILISWAGRGEEHPRAASRTREQADALAHSLLQRVRGGEPMPALMAEFSEDPGSAQSGRAYEVTPSAELVPPFKRLALRLEPGEAGLVLSEYGWHVIKRVE